MSLSQTYGDETPKEEKDTKTKGEGAAADETTEVKSAADTGSQEATGGNGDHEENDYSESERAAMAKGWKPDGVPGKPKLSADEFLRNEQFFDRIHKQNKTIKSLEKQLDEVVKQHSRIAEVEREKALDELKAAKKTAYENENYDEVVELDEKIAEVRTTKAETTEGETSDEQANIDPDFYTWQAQNKWYDPEANPDLFAEATAIGEAYNRLTGTAGTALYDHVASQMSKLYPERVTGQTPAAKRTGNVESGARSPRPRQGKKTYSKSDLNSTQRRVMERYVSGGLMTEQDYIDELVKIGEIG